MQRFRAAYSNLTDCGLNKNNEGQMKNKMSSKTIKIIIDIFMTIFLVLSFIRWDDSNFAFHAIVGFGCALFFALHICVHRKWIKAATKSLFNGKLNRLLIRKYVIDVLLLLVWGIAIVTGFLAVGYFSFDIDSMYIFSRLHAVASRIGLALVIVHIYQHIPQIKSYFRTKQA